MSVRGLALLVVVVLALNGCGTGQLPRVAEHPLPTVSRLQKPDADRPKASPSILKQTSHQFTDPAGGRVATRIRAIVNNTPILEEEVREAAFRAFAELQGLPEAELAVKQREIVQRELQQLIERELILQDMMGKLKGREKVLDSVKQAAHKEFDKQVQAIKKAVKEKLNIHSDDDFKAFVQSQGMSLDGMRRQKERDFMATAYVRSRVDQALERIGHEEIRDYYRVHADEFQTVDKVKWQHIFIDASRFKDRAEARGFAEQLVKQARGGADFAKLAGQYDHGDSKYRGGDGYGQRRGEIQPPEMEPYLFQMRDADVGPVIELGNGFHVFKLVKRDQAGLLPLDDKLQTTIRNKLKNEVWEREYKRIVAELRRKATIEIADGGP